ncbi:DUF881 domain-containing protein [Nocardioides sp. URHA0020]|uniref:DUF881 domain-containing protein n=1 Tax=Nocardioides sp. URHA0020 TaxID=1380392 RepID=UPI00048FD69A|nr:DUF881 domain-containing protein [Nocardioides sp. URHA0020]
MPDAPTVPDRARTPLLTLITQESLDEDYQHVAQQRAEARARMAQGEADTPPRRRHWVAAAVVGGFGLLITVAAVQTSEQSGVASSNRESLLRQIDQRQQQSTALDRRLIRLRESTIVQQDALDQATAADTRVSNRITQLGATTGFGAVSGPGVRITVDDAPNGEAVRAKDLALLTNGLWEAGAEAISVNGKRLTARSALFNSGDAINLTGSPPLSPPYVVEAIGDNDTLQADLIDTSTGLAFSNVAEAFGFPVRMQNVDDLSLPAAAPRQLRHAVKGTAEENAKPDGKKEDAP